MNISKSNDDTQKLTGFLNSALKNTKGILKKVAKQKLCYVVLLVYKIHSASCYVMILARVVKSVNMTEKYARDFASTDMVALL